jgi:hypothetical protein
MTIPFNALSAGLGFLNKMAASRADRAFQKHHNRMVNMQAAQQQNSIGSNVLMNREQTANNKLLIQTSRLIATAKAKAGSAAAGVAGGSVEGVIYGVGRNAGTKQHQEARRFQTTLLVTDQQRRGVEMSRAMSQKALTPKPSILSALGNYSMTVLGAVSKEQGSAGTTLNGMQQNDETLAFSDIRNML